MFIINYADGPGFRSKSTVVDGEEKCGRVAPADVKVSTTSSQTIWL